MGIFDHEHRWITVKEITVRPKKDDLPTKMILVEECRCGGVRTILVEDDGGPLVQYGRTACS